MPVKGDFYCKTHDKRLKQAQARQHHKAGCDVWYLKDGELSHRYGEKAKSEILVKTEARKHLNQSGADIEEHFEGFKEPNNETLFIYYKGGKIQKFWDRFGDHESIYRALIAGGHFNGSPAEFVDASARYMLAVAGYEPTPCIIPASMRQAYDETARLIREGMLKVYYDEDGKMTLEVNQEKTGKETNARYTFTRGGVSQGAHQHQPGGLSS